MTTERRGWHEKSVHLEVAGLLRQYIFSDETLKPICWGGLRFSSTNGSISFTKVKAASNFLALYKVHLIQDVDSSTTLTFIIFSYLQTSHSYSYCSNDQQVVSQKLLQLSDATTLQGQRLKFLKKSYNRQHIVLYRQPLGSYTSGLISKLLQQTREHPAGNMWGY